MRILSIGSTGPAVQLLQLALNRAGCGALALDGRFGPATQKTLMAFQTAAGLVADGIAGGQTHRALRPWYTGYLLHTLCRGESFWTLSRRYGSTVEAIRTANPALDPERLPAGMQLVVPLPFDVVPTQVAWFSELVEDCVQGLSARYPFLRRSSIGRSALGRELWSLTAGSGERRVLYNAEHHANEWITTPLLLRFLEELARAFSAGGELDGQRASALLDKSTLCLIPAMNPDGMDLVTGELQQGDAFEAARRMAAAYPRFPFPAGWKANLQGIDLNLQYPAGWEQAREIKFSRGSVSPAPADFVGTAPLEAPEARALYAFTQRFSPALIQAWHPQGEVIYWKYLNFEPPFSRAIAELYASASGYALEEAPYAAGFAGYKDWFIRDYNRPGYTIEAGKGVNPLPIGDFDAIYSRCRPILTLGLSAE